MNLYFHFPEKFDEDKLVITSFKNILTHPQKSDFNLFYSEDNLINFKKYNEETEVYLLDEIKIIRQFLISSKSIKVNKLNNETNYIQWNFDKYETFPCIDSLTNIAKEIYQDDSYKYIFINLDYAISTCRNKILVFRDCKHYTYPDFFVKIDFVVNDIEFNEWIKTKHVKEFSLKDELLFQKKPSIIVKGATVYYEIANDRYWHIDTFHEYLEYEIYNSNGIHIATANEKGNINFEGAEKGRYIKL